tara:strand:- start:465 stop:641 length:177 start_codon:yes stop_codon:yes gene_type:complete
MNKKESSLTYSEGKKNKKNSFIPSKTGITISLLEKYKSKNDFIVIDNQKKEKEFNKAA